VADFFLLGFLGGHPAEEPYITASRLASVFYFGFFLVILPLTSHLEPVMAQEMVKEYRIRQEKEAVADRLPAEIRIHAFLKTQEAIEEDLEWLSENFDHLPIRRNRRKHSKKR
jgi:hypothetical protein